MKKILSALALAVVAVAATAAPVNNSLTLEGFEHSPTVTGKIFYDINGTAPGGRRNDTVYIGGYNASYFDGFLPDSFVAYCIELTQSTGAFGSGFQYGKVSPVVNGTDGGQFTDLRFDRLTNLFGNNGGAGTFSADESAAMQLAIWEVMYETSSSALDVSSGNLRVTQVSSSVTALANQLLAGADDSSWANSGPGLFQNTVTLDLYNSMQYQDFITGSFNAGQSCGIGNDGAVCNPIPEPSSLALILAGLAGVGFVSRRRLKA